MKILRDLQDYYTKLRMTLETQFLIKSN